jgi:hypothetical protein
LKDAGIELDALTLLPGLGVLLLLLVATALGMLFGMRTQRRRARQSGENPVAVENAHEHTIALRSAGSTICALRTSASANKARFCCWSRSGCGRC